MDKVLFKATATATDEGVFTAVISAQSVDREGDRVNPEAMVTALKAWEQTGKNIPLHWNHSGAAEDVFGHVVPGSAQAINGEVHVEGWVDQSTPRGKDAWRLIKSQTLGFSFGYLIPEGGATKNAHGGLDINALDVFEVTATPTPMNNDTRVTGWKGAKKQLASATEDMLESAGRDKYAGSGIEVDVEDFDPDAKWVVFEICDQNAGTEKYLRMDYSISQDAAALADQAVEVMKTVAYTAKSMSLSGADLQRKVQEVLDGKSADVTDEQPKRAGSVDPLREQAMAVVHEVMLGDLAGVKASQDEPPPPLELRPADELAEEARALVITTLTGVTL